MESQPKSQITNKEIFELVTCKNFTQNKYCYDRQCKSFHGYCRQLQLVSQVPIVENQRNPVAVPRPGQKINPKEILGIQQLSNPLGLMIFEMTDNDVVLGHFYSINKQGDKVILKHDTSKMPLKLDTMNTIFEIEVKEKLILITGSEEDNKKFGFIVFDGKNSLYTDLKEQPIYAYEKDGDILIFEKTLVERFFYDGKTLTKIKELKMPSALGEMDMVCRAYEKFFILNAEGRVSSWIITNDSKYFLENKEFFGDPELPKVTLVRAFDTPEGKAYLFLYYGEKKIIEVYEIHNNFLQLSDLQLKEDPADILFSQNMKSLAKYLIVQQINGVIKFYYMRITTGEPKDFEVDLNLMYSDIKDTDCQIKILSNDGKETDYILLIENGYLNLYQWIEEIKFYKKDKETRMKPINYNPPVISPDNLSSVSPLFVNIFQCPICLEISKEPTECSTCEQIFCKKCIDDCVQRKTVCPTCRQQFAPKQIDRNIRTVYERSLMPCPFGCNALIEFGALDKHSEECPKLEKRPYQGYTCGFCDFYGEKEELLSHLKTCQKMNLNVHI
ncbi:MAG: hypothetical protein MJ252_12245 [archaeon]|nr:hypothetical protein [archaeon]